MGKPYSLDLRERIVGYVDEGHSARAAAGEAAFDCGAQLDGYVAAYARNRAATPGIDFDPDRGRHFVRFSFAGREAVMAEAAQRLKEWIKG